MGAICITLFALFHSPNWSYAKKLTESAGKFRLVIFGIIIGSVLFMLCGGVIKNQLYGIGGITFLYLLVGALIMLTVSLVASMVPAVRAARVDPNLVLSGD